MDENSSSNVSVNDYLAWNILATILCCLPLGIAGIIFSCAAKSAARVGDFQTARSKAATAKTLFFISLVIGLIVILGGIVLNVASSGDVQIEVN